MPTNNTPEMTVEELMKPRYKVIAIWPNTEYKVGDILAPDYHIEKTIKWCESFPHLFKRLEWWEDRKPEEMPEYVRVIEDPGKGSLLYLPDYEKGSNNYEFVVNWENLFMMHISFTEPATLAEYTQYINSKQ